MSKQSCCMLLSLACGIGTASAETYNAVTASEADTSESAKSDADEIEVIVVTATRTGRKTNEIPAGVSTVTNDDLRNMRMMGVKEALDGLPGVQSETRNGGYDARLIIRGGGLKARYAVREIMVLLDGVPVTDPDGLSRLDVVDTQLVERIDVVRGPNSTLYGANAAAGVVNIITKSPFDEVQSAKVGYGSYNTKLYNVILGTNVASDSYVTLIGSKKSTDGWRRRNQFESDHWSLKFGHLLDDDDLVVVNAYYARADLQLTGPLTQDEYNQNIKQRTSKPFRHGGRYSDVFSSSVRSTLDFDALILKPLVYFQRWHHIHPVTGQIIDGGADIYGADIQADFEHSLLSIDGTLIMGVAGQLDASKGKRFTYRDLETETTPYPPPGYDRILRTLSDIKGELAEESTDMVGKWGVYLQESLRPTHRWLIDLGVRYDSVHFDLETERYQQFVYGVNRYQEQRASIAAKKTFGAVSPRLGTVFKVFKETSIYANISNGFQTPQSAEIEKNRKLTPARTTNYEVGIKARHDDRHSMDISFFYVKVKDEIVLSRLNDGETAYSNAGSAIKKGVEVDLRLRPRRLNGLVVGGAYAFSDFTFDQFDEPIWTYNPSTRRTELQVFDRAGKHFPYVPKHQYSVFLRYLHPRGFKIGAKTLTWGEYFVDNANSDTHTGYRLLTHGSVGWQNDNWDITLDATNVFDKHYAMEATKDGDELMFRPGAPRSVFTKVSYRL